MPLLLGTLSASTCVASSLYRVVPDKRAQRTIGFRALLGVNFQERHRQKVGLTHMGWANHYIEKLQAGERVSFRPRGNSMTGKVENGQLVTLAPVGEESIHVGDIVLCKVNGVQYLHLVKAISDQRYQIGNNRGRVNGWTSRKNIFGIVIQVSA
jgi:hypothetical protein